VRLLHLIKQHHTVRPTPYLHAATQSSTQRHCKHPHYKRYFAQWRCVMCVTGVRVLTCSVSCPPSSKPT
jgi:hypothetical protein